MIQKSLSHDQLQSKCHVWMWNNYPELRGLFHTNFSDFKVVDRLLGALAGIRITQQQRSIILSQLKTIGLVKGTWDSEFLYAGILHYLECKILPDDLSPEQIEFKRINENNGANFHVYHDFEEFENIIKGIVK